MNIYNTTQHNVNQISTYPFADLPNSQLEQLVKQNILDLMLYTTKMQQYYLTSVSPTQLQFSSEDKLDTIVFQLTDAKAGQPKVALGQSSGFIRGSIMVSADWDAVITGIRSLSYKIHTYCLTPLMQSGAIPSINIGGRSFDKKDIKIHLTQNIEYKNSQQSSTYTFQCYSYYFQTAFSTRHIKDVNGINVQGKSCTIKPFMLSDARVLTQGDTVKIGRLCDA